MHMFITHRPTLTLQLHNFDLFRTCRTSSFYTVVWQLAIFQLTRCIVWSLGDSWACCAPTWRVGSWLDLGIEDHSFHKNAACSLLWYYHSLYFSWCSCGIDQNVFALLTESSCLQAAYFMSCQMMALGSSSTHFSMIWSFHKWFPVPR